MSKEEFEARERVRLKVEEQQRKEGRKSAQQERESVTVPSPVEVGSAGGDQF